GIGERAGPGAGDELRHRDARAGRRLDEADALLHGERVRLSRRAERSQPVAAIVEQPAAMLDEERRIRLEGRGERRQDGGIDAARLRGGGGGHDRSLRRGAREARRGVARAGGWTKALARRASSLGCQAAVLAKVMP